MKKYAIIAAGGCGNRMISAIPKQFIPLAGIPVLMHSVRAFHNADTEIEIIVVLPVEQQPVWKKLCAQHNFNIPHTVVAGGETRFHSVKNGLDEVNDADGIVAVHDAVRPLVSAELIKKLLSEAEINGTAIPAIAVEDSLRKINNSENLAANRADYRIVQTPQCFQTRIIKTAFQQPFNPMFTDEAAVAEAAGQYIHLVEGEKKNIKITVPDDLVVAESLLSRF